MEGAGRRGVAVSYANEQQSAASTAILEHYISAVQAAESSKLQLEQLGGELAREQQQRAEVEGHAEQLGQRLQRAEDDCASAQAAAGKCHAELENWRGMDNLMLQRTSELEGALLAAAGPSLSADDSVTANALEDGDGMLAAASRRFEANRTRTLTLWFVPAQQSAARPCCAIDSSARRVRGRRLNGPRAACPRMPSQHRAVHRAEQVR